MGLFAALRALGDAERAMSPEARTRFRAEMRRAQRESLKSEVLVKGRMLVSFVAAGVLTGLIWGNGNSRGWPLLWEILTLAALMLLIWLSWEHWVQRRRRRARPGRAP